MIRTLLPAFILAISALAISAASARAQSLHVQVDTFPAQRILDIHACPVTRDSLPACGRPDRPVTRQPSTPVPPAAGQDSHNVQVNVEDRSVSEPMAPPERRGNKS